MVLKLNNQFKLTALQVPFFLILKLNNQFSTAQLKNSQQNNYKILKFSNSQRNSNLLTVLTVDLLAVGCSCLLRAESSKEIPKLVEVG